MIAASEPTRLDAPSAAPPLDELVHPHERKRTTQWASWLVGAAALAAVVVVAQHFAEEREFVAIIARAKPWWLAVAVLLQLCTYAAQGQVWRVAASASGTRLPLPDAYKLSLAKLFVDQAVPSAGLSGTLVFARALGQRGMANATVMTCVLIDGASYYAAYVVCLATALLLAAMTGHANATIVAASLVFIVFAVVVSGVMLAFAGRRAPRIVRPLEHFRFAAGALKLLEEVDGRVVRDPRLLLRALAWHIVIVLLDTATIWFLVLSLGSVAPVVAVFISFMTSTLFRTIGIVPGGLGTFEAASVLTLKLAGIPVAVALSATLAFRVLSFWLPMVPGLYLSRAVERRARASGQIAPTRSSSTPVSQLARQPQTASTSAALLHGDGARPLATMHESEVTEHETLSRTRPLGNALKSALGVPPFWRAPLGQAALGFPDADVGLSESQAQARLLDVGENIIRPRQERRLTVDVLHRLANPLVLVLLVSSAVAWATGELESLVILSIIVVVSVALDLTQERRAKSTARRLQQSVEHRARVRRDGKTKTVPAREIVPGDVVLLAAGDIVPADGRLVETRELFVKEAPLTGEPYPVEKKPGDVAPETSIADATNAVFLGSTVTSGTGRFVVCATGLSTALGQTAQAIEKEPPPTEFERGTRAFGMLIMRMAIILVVFVLVVSAIVGRSFLESLLFAIAIAVGITPELLPMVVSVTLARGALVMSKKRVIVKQMPAIEDLGSMDVLCTDKTGTLTAARIRLDRHVDAAGSDSDRTLALALLNSRFASGVRSPLDDAILEHDAKDATGWRLIDEVPFEFERRRVSVLVEQGHRRLLIVKGAAEDVLHLSTSMEDRTGVVIQLDETEKGRAAATMNALSQAGLRLLGVAYREMDLARGTVAKEDERELTFVGFAAFQDPPKDSARAALDELGRLGVRVKVITGDNELVARHVVDALGLGVGRSITGSEIDRLDDEHLAARADACTLFARVSPAQKRRIVLALKARGHVVGYLGDGINDAPSLHAADVGISVDDAVDVAREAAQIILLEKDLRVLKEGVIEGRRTFANIMKYIMMGTSSAFGNMLSMAGATVFLPFLPMRPVQILLNNLLYDFSELAIPFDNVDDEDVKRPRRWDMRFVRSFMLTLGPISSIFDFLTFFLLFSVLRATEAQFQAGWFIESMMTQVLVVLVIRTWRAPWKSRPAPALALAAVAVTLLAAIVPFTPLGRAFAFSPPPAIFAVLVIGLVVVYLSLADAAKRVFFAWVLKERTL